MILADYGTCFTDGFVHQQSYSKVFRCSLFVFCLLCNGSRHMTRSVTYTWRLTQQPGNRSPVVGGKEPKATSATTRHNITPR